jgi:hypothetical protein
MEGGAQEIAVSTVFPYSIGDWHYDEIINYDQNKTRYLTIDGTEVTRVDLADSIIPKTLFIGDLDTYRDPTGGLGLFDEVSLQAILPETSSNIRNQTLLPIEDTYIISNEPLENFGHGFDLLTTKARTSSGPIHAEILMKFNLSQLPKNSEILQGILFLYRTTRSIYIGYGTSFISAPKGGRVTTHLLTNDEWHQENLTWLSRPTYNQSVLIAVSERTLDFKIIHTGGGWISLGEEGYVNWNVTDAILSEYPSDGILSICVRAEENMGDDMNFDSIESAYWGRGYSPALFVYYTDQGILTSVFIIPLIYSLIKEKR